MKNFQVVDGAMNATFSIYSIEDELFDIIFPHNQNIQFDADLINRLTKNQKKMIFPKIWDNELEKNKVNGIHGTIYYGYEYLALRDCHLENNNKNYCEMAGFNDRKKCIQVIENKISSQLLTYQISDSSFELIFLDDQNMEYEIELLERLGQNDFDSLWKDMLSKPIDKRNVNGIDGTIFLGDKYLKGLKEDFPLKKYIIKNPNAK